uniref:Nibrin n=1 Tax=Periophthalmus magnuspinnatus TaxID=409849 RepID=A0A3B4BDV9_9GOBI
MWILTPLQPGGQTHYLQSGKNYVVGRKNCDIILSDDQSISRAHAHLSSSEKTLTVKDMSKYGTSVNEQQLAQNTPVNLTSGSNITFGVFNSKFRVEHLHPVVCSSCLDNSGKTSLLGALQLVGGKLVGTWSQDCTHLVMSSVKVTIKTICALLCGCPIVTPEFFSALQAAIENKSPPPEAERFTPEINEPSLNKDKIKIGVISKRRELFTGKTFVFLNAKQMTRLSAAVSYGGGSCTLLDETSLPRDILESPQSCVIDVTSSASQPVLSSSTMDWVNTVKSIVEKKGLRVITESEIGVAAIYASCKEHCNSSHSVSKMKSRIPSASLTQSVAVDETVLPAPSLNITAYAANTEPSQGYDVITCCPIRTIWQLEDDFTAETSQPKRTAQDSLITSQPPQTSKETRSEKAPTDLSQSSGRETQSKTQGQKRKEMDDNELEELESLMSEDMDCFDAPPPRSQNQAKMLSSKRQKELEELESLMSEDMDCFDAPPPRGQNQAKMNTTKPQKEVSTAEVSRKRPRLQEQNKEDDRKSKQFDLEKPSTSSSTPAVKIKAQNISINIDAFEHTKETYDNRKSSNPPAKPPSKTLGRKKQDQFLFADMSELPTKVTKQKQSNGCTKNFKCFRKVHGVAPVIRGADLLAHNRGRNSDLDEWLRDAVEEDQQSRRDESVGDDLFR